MDMDRSLSPVLSSRRRSLSIRSRNLSAQSISKTDVLPENYINHLENRTSSRYLNFSNSLRKSISSNSSSRVDERQITTTNNNSAFQCHVAHNSPINLPSPVPDSISESSTTDEVKFNFSKSQIAELSNTLTNSEQFCTSTPQSNKFPPLSAKKRGLKASRLKQIQISNEALRKGSKIFEDLEFDSNLSGVWSEKQLIDNLSEKKTPSDDIIDITDTQMNQVADQACAVLAGFGDSQWHWDEVKIKTEPPDVCEDFIGFDDKSVIKTEQCDLAHNYDDCKYDLLGFDDCSSHSCESVLKLAITNMEQPNRKRTLDYDTEICCKKHRLNCFEQFSLNNDRTTLINNIENTESNLKKETTNTEIGLANSALSFKNKYTTLEVKLENLSAIIDPPITIMNQGFKTASNKAISISESACKKTKSLFSDIDNFNAFNNLELSENAVTFPNSKKNSAVEKENSILNMDIKFPDTSSSVTNVLFANTNNFNSKFDVKTKRRTSFKSTTTTKVQVRNTNFKLVSHKPINISQSVAEKGKGVDDPVCLNTKRKLPNNFENRITSHTLSNKKPLKSKICFENQRSQNWDIETGSSSKNCILSNEQIIRGFQTASNKIISISKSAEEKAKNLFVGIDDLLLDTDSKIIVENIETRVERTSLKGSSSNMQFSSEKCVENMGVMQACEKTELNLKNGSVVKYLDQPIIGGFQTASNKAISISKSAEEKARVLFKDIEDSISDNNSKITDNTSVSTNTKTNKLYRNQRPSFQTSDCKRQFSSGSSVENTRLLNESKPKNKELNLNNDEIIKQMDNLMFGGFQTASNKAISISKSAEEKAIVLFMDIDDSISDNNSKITDNTSVSSNTKSNEFHRNERTSFKVSVCKNQFNTGIPAENTNLLNEGKPKSTELNLKNGAILEQLNQPIIDGFQTASNKTISISRTALEKTKKLFANIDDFEEENSENNVSFSHDQRNKLYKQPFRNKEINLNVEYADENVCPNEQMKLMKPVLMATNNIIPLSEIAIQKPQPFENLGDIQTVPISQRPGILAEQMITDDEYNVADETVIEDIDTYSEGTNFSDVCSGLSVEDFDATLHVESAGRSRSNEKQLFQRYDHLYRNNVTLDEGVYILAGDKPKPRCLQDRINELEDHSEHLRKLLCVMDERKAALLKQHLNKTHPTADHLRHRSGILLEKRMTHSRRQSLKETFRDRNLCLKDFESNMLLETLWKITPENAANIFFHCSADSPTLTFEDGAILVPSDCNNLGYFEFETAFFTVQGVDGSKVPEGWLLNHFTWIIWKLASYDRQNYGRFKDFFLTPKNILEQLKYRYDRDIFENQRSAIRKIIEKDDTSVRTMVLCVSKITLSSPNKYDIQLTDGWYSIRAEFDAPLQQYVKLNKIVVGTKLITTGAELLNHTDACHPLQVQLDVRIKLHCNSTRRARWYTKLGFQHVNQPLVSSLSSIALNGGLINVISVYLARVFPLKYLEQTPNGSWKCRCANAERKRELKWQNEQDMLSEKAHDEALRQLENEWKNTANTVRLSTSANIKDMKSPKKLYNLIVNSHDPESVHNLLSSSQKSAIERYRSTIESERRGALQARMGELLNKWGHSKRKFVTIFTAILLDAQTPSLSHSILLEIYRPNDTIFSLLKEENVVKLHNVVTNENRSCLTSNPQTRFEIISPIIKDEYTLVKRLYTSIGAMQQPAFTAPFGYCDTIGFIVSNIKEESQQFIWVADECQRFLRITNNSKIECSCFDGYHTGDRVAILNLVPLKMKSGILQANITDVTIVTQNSAYTHLQDVYQRFGKNLTMSIKEYVNSCKKKIDCWSADYS